MSNARESSHRNRVMSKLNLPHKEPLLFAKEVIKLNEDEAVVKIAFDTIPSLAMLTEAAAQSSAAFGTKKQKIAQLVMLKNVKLLEKLKEKEYLVEVKASLTLGHLKHFDFKALDKTVTIATGSFVIAF